MVELNFAAATKAVLIAGPTASGKSTLALDLAKRVGGLVINADSMQVYSELRILTARPDAESEATMEHLLYGHVPAATRYSVGSWLDDIAGALQRAKADDRLAIIVGGTGLYFKALVEGLAATPPVPNEIRQEILAAAEGEASETLHRRLGEIDPQDAALIRPSDRARIIRAMEVFTATGRALADWRSEPAKPLLDLSMAECLVLNPERALLHKRIGERVDEMIDAGAIEEAVALGALGLSGELPAMKAIGVRQLIEHHAGKLTLDEALAGIKTETRRYAKRQMTWFRHQMADWPRLSV